VVARDIITEFDQPGVGRVRQPKPAAQFAVNRSAIKGPAPRIGEHTREVLRELAYSDDDIDRMIAEKSVRAAAN
jgi:crotonobetainyl-CoA:carnitine CoA-transferase CaiB-like acyl-CoA transferase